MTTTTNVSPLQIAGTPSLRPPRPGYVSLGFVSNRLVQRLEGETPTTILNTNNLADYVLPDRSVNGHSLEDDISLSTNDIGEGTTNLYHVQSDLSEVDPSTPSFVRNLPTFSHYHAILNKIGTALAQRGHLRFQGGGIFLSDSAADDRTIVAAGLGDEGGMKNPMEGQADLIASTDDSGTPGRIAVGSAGQVLAAGYGGEPVWSTPTANPLEMESDLIVGDVDGAPRRIAVGTSGKVLAIGANGIPSWSSQIANPISTAGDLITATSGGTPARLGKGSAGQTLQVLSSTAMAWADEADDPSQNFWPGNVLFNQNSYAAKPMFYPNVFVAAADGWTIYQDSADIANPSYAYPVPAEGPLGWETNDLCIERSVGNGNTAAQLLRIFRPFSSRETAPLVGKKVTLSLGFKADSGFPKTSAGYVRFFVVGTSNKASQTSINYYGNFPSLNSTLANSGNFYSFSTVAFARRSLTFEVPSTITQIVLAITHAPYQTGSSVASNYRLYIRRPAIRLGTSAAEPLLPSAEEDRLGMTNRFQRVFVQFSGPVEDGETVVQTVAFPIPMETAGNVICMRAIDASAPSAFPSADRLQITSANSRSFTVARTANATESNASFATWYHFAIPLWEFSDPIPAYNG
ncbi:MAG: hypothetical protein LBT98_03480 [Puniceicoccales bacterium]|jgi:hypothetical protein|nr:hypothetical protein [Puniceicoccales bacterium]